MTRCSPQRKSDVFAPGIDNGVQYVSLSCPIWDTEHEPDTNIDATPAPGTLPPIIRDDGLPIIPGDPINDGLATPPVLLAPPLLDPSLRIVLGGF